LEERVVGTSLWRDTPDVPAVGVLGECGTVPGLDGVGRVCQHDVERLQMALAVEERRSAEGVAVSDVTVCDPVQEQIHPRDGGCPVIELLTVEAQIPPLLALPLQFGGGGDEHAARAASGVVYRLTRLGLE